MGTENNSNFVFRSTIWSRSGAYFGQSSPEPISPRIPQAPPPAVPEGGQAREGEHDYGIRAHPTGNPPDLDRLLARLLLRILLGRRAE